MFIGHFAVGFAAKAARPTISLGVFFIAVQFVDLLWPTLLLFNLEQVAIEPGNTATTPLNFLHYPISHSLLMAGVWSLMAFIIIYLWKKDIRTGVLVGACVASHWLLDFITHRPDLPIGFSESIKVGLGLWNYKIVTLIVEILIFVGGVWLYLQTTVAKNKTGKYAFWGLIAFFLIIHASNMAGPPPPNVEAIAWAGHLQWLFVIWAFWIDRNRKSGIEGN